MKSSNLCKCIFLLLVCSCSTTKTTVNQDGQAPSSGLENVLQEPFSFDKLQEQGPYGQVYAALLQGQVPRAVALFEKHKDSFDPELKEYLSFLLDEAQGKINLSRAETVQQIAKKLEEKPNARIEEYLLSRLLEAGRTPLAESLIKRFVRRTRGQGRWATWMGWVYLQKSRPSLARYQFQRAIALEGDPAMAWFGLGRVYELERNASAAEEAYRQALILQPWVGAIHLRMALQKIERQDTEGAAYHVDAAVMLHPANDPAVHYLQGRYHHAKGDQEEALRLYSLVLDKEPDHRGALVNSAKILADLPGRLSDAKSRIRKAADLERRTDVKKQLIGWYRRLSADKSLRDLSQYSVSDDREGETRESPNANPDVPPASKKPGSTPVPQQ